MKRTMMRTAPALDPPLAEALAILAAAMRDVREPWWIIGSAAMALHGVRPLVVGDLDLLTGPAEARRLLGAWGVRDDASSSLGRFRSEAFGRWRAGTLPVDVMGGFHVRVGDEWRPVQPQTRKAVRAGEALLFVPSLDELAEMCRLFGRPKDLERERLIAAHRPA
jgi:hypothetical protein